MDGLRATDSQFISPKCHKEMSLANLILKMSKVAKQDKHRYIASYVCI